MSKDMCIYYFHVRRGNVIYLDHEGLELADLRSAWHHAVEDARIVLRTRRDEAIMDRWIEVHDLHGHLVSAPPPEVTFH